MIEELRLRSTPESLVEAARRGDREAFDELYRRYCRLVARRALVLLGSGCGADDVVQETFERAYRNLDRYRGDAPFVHWLLRIATNLARSAHRSRWHRRFFPLLGDEPRAEGADASPSRYPDLDALHRALGRLSFRLREAVLLHEIEGLTLQELASVQKVSTNTAASRVRRGRDQLRRQLRALGFDPLQDSAVVEAVTASPLCKGETS